MKLNLNRPLPSPSTPPAVTTNPALKQIFQRLAATPTPVQKAA